ncbi:MAG: hypothetical protein ACETWE_11245 [Candidatus Bathyarchaeia archaeon]
MFLKYLSVQFVFGDGVMDPSLLPEHIAVIGLCIFVALSQISFFRKNVFQRGEESSRSLKVQLIYLLAAAFGVLLVREEFAAFWGGMRFTCSIAYLAFSLACIPALTLRTAFLRSRGPPETPSSTSEERGGEKAEEREKREEDKEEEKGIIQEAEEFLRRVEK